MLTMVLTAILFVVGLALVWKGADVLVDGATSIAARFRVPPLVVGLTLVSFGTSAPELAVNVTAAARGVPDLALGNIIGSNIANTLLVLGAAALFRVIAVERRTVWIEIPVAAVATLVLLIQLNDRTLDGTPSMLTRGDGIILLLFFVIFLYYLGLMVHRLPHGVDADAKYGPTTSVLLVIGGGVALWAGSEWIVGGARAAAEALDVSPGLVGLTLVALGTSLPELAASVTAALRGSTDLAMGNVVGSNIFNIFWILGLTATIAPVGPDPGTNLDLGVALGASLLLVVLIMNGRKRSLDRAEGVLLLLMYAGYLAVLAARF